jgi:amidase
LTEIFFDRALDSAKKLDQYFADHGRPLGPLHGLPISLKDSFNIIGVHSTIGYVSFINNPPASTNSVLVDILLANGAVLYVKTNIPQTMMAGDSHNNIFGRVLNPNKLCLGAGGSSGGEGALVRLRGSVLGIGTDIAGSIRIPSASCGTYGFTPSLNRVPYGGKTNPTRDGFSLFQCVAGPIATNVGDLRLLMETVIKSSPWNYDPSALAIPWSTVEKKQHLTVGVLTECPSWPVTPPMKRSTRSAVDKLSQAGHQVVEISHFPSYAEATRLAWESLDIDNEETVFAHIRRSGEPVVKCISDMYPTPPGGRPLKPLDDLYALCQRREIFRRDWLKIFVDNKLDVLITPGSHQTAVPHDTYSHPAYTVMWNVVSVSHLFRLHLPYVLQSS